MASNSFGTQDQLTVDDETYIIHRLARIDGAARLPYSLKVLLENLLRNEDGRLVTAEQVSAVAAEYFAPARAATVVLGDAKVVTPSLSGVFPIDDGED